MSLGHLTQFQSRNEWGDGRAFRWEAWRFAWSKPRTIYVFGYRRLAGRLWWRL